MTDGGGGHRSRRSRVVPAALLGVAVLAAGVLVLVLVVAVPHGREDTVLEDPVVVGHATDKPGVTFRDPVTGQRSGFDISLIRWMAGLTEDGRDPFVPVETDVRVNDREQSLQRGDAGGVDLVISSYTITGSRERQVDFAGPYLKTQQGVMLRADDPRTVRNPTQLGGRAVCAEAGSTSIEELRRIPDVIVVEGDGLLDCVGRLRAGRVDAVSTDQLLLYGTAQDDPSLRVEQDVRFGALQQYGIGLPPEDGTESCELVNGYLDRFLGSGAWDAAFEANFGTELDKAAFRPDQRPCEQDEEEAG